MMYDLKPDFEVTLKRMDAFWERELLDRPLVQFTLYKPPDERVPLPPSRHANPAARWLDAQYQAEWQLVNLSNQLFLGDSLPVAWPNLGPDVFAALYGCPLRFGDYGTSWSEPVLLDWGQAGELALDWDGFYLHKLDELTDALLQTGEGRFITGMTDWHADGDCLAALRGAQKLALDLLEHPTEVKILLERVHLDYERLYNHFYARLRAAGQPITTWTPLACQGRYYLPSCDFSAMIGVRAFEEFFLPGIRRECRFLDRSLYHLDGPGALRHLESILAIPELDAVQYVPTIGDAAFNKWAPVYRRIQAAGKGVQVTCELGEVSAVMEALDPRGVYLVVDGVPERDSAEALLAQLARWPLRRVF